MPIEALYPYAIMGYSFFVTILAVYLWKLTNLNVDGTRTNIEKQVAAAVTDIRGESKSMLGSAVDRIDGALKGLDLSSIEKRVDGLAIKFTEVADNIPDFDEDALLARLDRLETGLPNIVGTHVSMAVKGVQAEQARAVADYLADTLPEWERMSKDAQAELMGQVNPAEIIGNAILNYKIPPQIRKKAPWAIPLIEGQKLQAMQWLQGIAALKAQGTVTMESGGYGGGSFQPGLRR